MSDGRWMVLGVRALCRRRLRAELVDNADIATPSVTQGWALDRWKLVAGEGGVRGGEARMVDSEGRATAACEDAE